MMHETEHHDGLEGPDGDPTGEESTLAAPSGEPAGAGPAGDESAGDGPAADEPTGAGPAGPGGEVNPDAVRVIEAIVMVSAEPVEPATLGQLLGLSAATIDGLCRSIAAAYQQAGAGFELVKVAGGWRYQSHADLAPYVERYILDGQTARLSAAALETLAIVAYKQPISRAQIASIRGVDPDGVLRTLQTRGYVDQIGRDPGPGQAVLWGTTPFFLEKLGLPSLADLPPLAEYVPGADVVEALEHGLRVTPIEMPAPAAAPVTGDVSVVEPGEMVDAPEQPVESPVESIADSPAG